MRLRSIVPRPQHSGADPQEQEEWKKNLATQVEQIRQSHPDCDVQLWAMDEHRAGLKPVMRRVWVDEWTTPIAKVNYLLSRTTTGCTP